MSNKLEARLHHQMRDIFFAAREEVVDAKDVVPLCEQSFTKMGAQETGTTRNEDSFHATSHHPKRRMRPVMSR
jgi:hypothetical protein